MRQNLGRSQLLFVELACRDIFEIRSGNFLRNWIQPSHMYSMCLFFRQRLRSFVHHPSSNSCYTSSKHSSLALTTPIQRFFAFQNCISANMSKMLLRSAGHTTFHVCTLCIMNQQLIHVPPDTFRVSQLFACSNSVLTTPASCLRATSFSSNILTIAQLSWQSHARPPGRCSLAGSANCLLDFNLDVDGSPEPCASRHSQPLNFPRGFCAHTTFSISLKI